MRRQRRSSIVRAVSLSAVLALCGPSAWAVGDSAAESKADAAQSDKAKAEAPKDAATAVRAANARLKEQLLAKDVDGLVRDFYAEGARVYPPGSEPLVGTEAIKRMWRDLVSVGKVTLDLVADDVQEIGEVAVEVGHFTVEIVPPATVNVPPLKDRGAYIVTWKRQADGAWRATHDIWNSSTPPTQ